MTPRLGNNRRLALLLALFTVAMIGLAYASVPLYSLFCRVTGFGGTTQRAATAPTDIKDRTITIRFDSSVNEGLDWEFWPEQRTMTVKVGEVGETKFHARNRATVPVVGTSTYNVQPDKVGGYFSKIQCFCFTEQLLQPGQTAEFPVQFFVDPAIMDAPENDDVREITLSYTFFRAKDQSKAQLPAAPPPP
jgi:cytochrome c oxidase assembly protein subunit 11